MIDQREARLILALIARAMMQDLIFGSLILQMQVIVIVPTAIAMIWLTVNQVKLENG